MASLFLSRSFLDSFWWGLMTLTTVGYGDLSPSTFPGKLIGKQKLLRASAADTKAMVNSLAIYKMCYTSTCTHLNK